MKFLLASLITLNDSENCSESSIKFLFRLSFVLTGQFFPVYINIRLLEQFSGSQAVYGTTLRELAAIRKPEQALKRLTGRNFKISKRFHRSKQEL